MHFFIPGLEEDPTAAEELWKRHCVQCTAPVTSRRVYKLGYEHGGDHYEVTVGQPRKVYRRRTGPRGGYIKNAGVQSVGVEVGTMVSTIIDTGGIIWVWSFGPPFGGWANPSMVGQGEVTSIEYFDNGRALEDPGESNDTQT